jgi:hypothetical protein
LIGDASAISHARTMYLPISQAQLRELPKPTDPKPTKKELSADDIGDSANKMDKYDRFDA